jgi:RNA polymerase sigma-70 factor (ECF subfamily)
VFTATTAHDRSQPLPKADEFDELYRAAFRRLVGQVFLLTGDVHEAEDAVQEAFARASLRWRRISAYDAPEAWVRRVAFNLATNSARRQRRRLAMLTRLGPPAEVPPLSDDVLALVAALGRLPARQRAPIVLHHLLDQPVEQVAAELGITPSAAKARLLRGRRALAALLTDTTTLEEGASRG